ncbi:hypothetical protein [uncultured Alloprevotella sp.]|nr:hypothetical protein [uncultured Alloprevotella sp.]
MELKWRISYLRIVWWLQTIVWSEQTIVWWQQIIVWSEQTIKQS